MSGLGWKVKGQPWPLELIYSQCHIMLNILSVHSRFANILKRKRKLVALLLLSYRCIVTVSVLWLFLTVSRVGLHCVIVVYPDHTHLLYFTFNRFPKFNVSQIFPFKCIRKQIWPWRYVGQGQPRMIIWRILVGLTSPMLHTKSQGDRPSGSGEGFKRVFIIYGHGGHLGHVAITIWTNFPSSILSICMKFEFN